MAFSSYFLIFFFFFAYFVTQHISQIWRDWQLELLMSDSFVNAPPKYGFVFDVLHAAYRIKWKISMRFPETKRNAISIGDLMYWN